MFEIYLIQGTADDGEEGCDNVDSRNYMSLYIKQCTVMYAVHKIDFLASALMHTLSKASIYHGKYYQRTSIHPQQLLK